MAYHSNNPGIWRRRFSVMWKICLYPNGWAQETVVEAAEFVYTKLPHFNQLECIERAHRDVVSYWMLLDVMQGREIESQFTVSSV